MFIKLKIMFLLYSRMKGKVSPIIRVPYSNVTSIGCGQDWMSIQCYEGKMMISSQRNRFQWMISGSPHVITSWVWSLVLEPRSLMNEVRFNHDEIVWSTSYSHLVSFGYLWLIYWLLIFSFTVVVGNIRCYHKCSCYD